MMCAGNADAATKATSVPKSGDLIKVDKARHDICVGFLDPSGVQHPLFCINLPQT
jgi:hypothetical protein